MATILPRAPISSNVMESLVRKLKWGAVSDGRVIARNTANCVEFVKLVREIEDLDQLGIMQSQLIEKVTLGNKIKPITEPPFFILSLTRDCDVRVMIKRNSNSFSLSSDNVLRVDEECDLFIDWNAESEPLLLLYLSQFKPILSSTIRWKKINTDSVQDIQIHHGVVRRNFNKDSPTLNSKLSSIDTNVLTWKIRSHLRMVISSVSMGWKRTELYLINISSELIPKFTAKQHLSELLPLLRLMSERGLFCWSLFNAFIEKAKELNYKISDVGDISLPRQIKMLL